MSDWHRELHDKYPCFTAQRPEVFDLAQAIAALHCPLPKPSDRDTDVLVCDEMFEWQAKRRLTFINTERDFPMGDMIGLLQTIELVTVSLGVMDWLIYDAITIGQGAAKR